MTNPIQNNPLKLKSNQIKPYRTHKIEEQSYTCPITNSEILTDEACLDHEHETGFCRGVLPRNINTAEGKIRNVYIR
ncbi:endonuclease domain-containing protein [Neptuniibacter sp. QD48_55]|uniref:endonuclease domain-containing protein n=1 Tax=Neptuniibacter sp. QD48_55 TaxID=3398212 RepID=UPI0039F489E3